MSTTAVTVGGFLLRSLPDANGSKVPHPDGSLWWCENIDGLDDSTSEQGERRQRAGQAGGYPAEQHAEGRRVVLEGVALFPSGRAAAVARDALMAAVPRDGVLVELARVNAVGYRSLMVQRDGAIGWAPQRGGVIRWRVPLWAPDPVLYGAPVRRDATLTAATTAAGLTYPLEYPRSYGEDTAAIPGSLFLPNDGTVPYWPRLVISRPCYRPTIRVEETGDWVRYGGSIAAGQTLELVTGERWVRVDGVLSARERVSYSGSWLAIPPGGGTVRWTADAADPGALLTAYGYEGAYE